MKVAAGGDDDHLAGHGRGAAHGNHHVGAVVLVGGLFQKRGGGAALGLLGPKIGCRSRALQSVPAPIVTGTTFIFVREPY
jgi:hypothetical protein